MRKLLEILGRASSPSHALTADALSEVEGSAGVAETADPTESLDSLLVGHPLTEPSITSKFGCFDVTLAAVHTHKPYHHATTIWPDPAQPVTSMRIALPYGRFGNNFYQIANASIIASRLGLRELQVPNYPLLSSQRPLSTTHLIITSHMPPSSDDNVLIGDFFMPFGLERLFDDMSDTSVLTIIKPVVDALYAPLLQKAVKPEKATLVAHFRGGDIFHAMHVHAWYVQPPAAYYLFAIEHALRQRPFDEIKLVFEDETNPALDVVRQGLAANGIRHTALQQTFEQDLDCLLSATCLIGAMSTLPEAVSIASPQVQMLYSFRSHSSQIDLAPFVQSRVGGLFAAKGGTGYVVDDSSLEFTTQKAWQNTTEQLELIRTFPIDRLRIYRSPAPR